MIMMDQPLYCQTCQSDTQFRDETLAVGNDGYLSLETPIQMPSMLTNLCAT